jgi:8-hydroxy-5-deazaflavin:NADPH oxidoreductase
MSSLPVVAVVGGTGNLGAAIARRLAQAGYPVIVGSRDAARARVGAATLSEALSTPIRGASNAEAARHASIVIVAVPFASQEQILADIRSSVTGKIVVDTTVPLVPPKVMRVQLPAEGCAALLAQKVLGEGVTVVSAFHNVPAHKLAIDQDVECDVLVFGDHKDAREQVIQLVVACRLRGLHGGPLANSAAAEALTSVLIFINKNYSVDGAGIRITRISRGSGG